MTPQVVKIGGSLLRRPEDYAALSKAVAQRVRHQPTWIVLSAAQGVTDALKALCQQADEAQVEALLGSTARHASAPVPPWLESELRRAIHGARHDTRPLLSWGEQASTWAFQQRLAAHGVTLPVVELYPRRLPPLVSSALVPGFYLRDRFGRARTLPRGGSDITAALLALRLGAGTLRYWKEGGGIRDAGATLARVDGHALLRRIEGSIRPLHPAALRIALHHGIAVVLEDPFGSHAATQVDTRPLAAATA